MSNESRMGTVISGSLWGLAVGNVLGLGVESFTRELAQAHLGQEGSLRKLPHHERELPWDDDLAMAMELADWLCEGGEELEWLLERYLRWLRENGRGAGSLTSEVLERVASGEPRAAQEIWECYSRFTRPPRGNGCLMRVAPVGLVCFREPSRCWDLAWMDAGLTHWDPICREASSFLALLVAAVVRCEREPLGWARMAMGSAISAELAEAITPIPLETLERRRLDRADMGYVLLCLQVAVSVFHSGLGYQDGLLWTLRQGGDADTNGAVVGALLGARDGIRAIPEAWMDCVPSCGEINNMADRIYMKATEEGENLGSRSGR